MVSSRIDSLIRILHSSKPEIRPERALLATESYIESEGLSIEIRRAKMLDKILDEIPVKIREGEIIVGCKTTRPMGSPLYPEVACDWIIKEIDTIGERNLRWHIHGSKRRGGPQCCEYARRRQKHCNCCSRYRAQVLVNGALPLTCCLTRT